MRHLRKTALLALVSTLVPLIVNAGPLQDDLTA
jgi:hypothetical protein